MGHDDTDNQSTDNSTTTETDTEKGKFTFVGSNNNSITGKEHWVKTYWRPSMAWLYMVICACDFVVFPLLSMVLPAFTSIGYTAWKPITLDNGGLIHLSFGTILGITAWTRGAYEKKRHTEE